MEVVVVAAIVAFTTVASPLLLAYLTGRQRQAEKKEDWRRQDEVAEAAAAAETSRAEKAAQVASDLLAANKLLTVVADQTNVKLDVIHGLVNSNLTVAKQAQYDALVVQLAMMREVVDLREASGQHGTKESIQAILATEEKVKALHHELDERAKEQRRVEIKEQTALLQAEHDSTPIQVVIANLPDSPVPVVDAKSQIPGIEEKDESSPTK